MKRVGTYLLVIFTRKFWANILILLTEVLAAKLVLASLYDIATSCDTGVSLYLV